MMLNIINDSFGFVKSREETQSPLELEFYYTLCSQPKPHKAQLD